MTRRSLPVDNPGLVTLELHPAERPALIEIADGVGRQLGLFGHRVLAMVFAAAGWAIAKVVGAVVVPPGALVIGRAVKNLEMNVGTIEPDPAQLHQILRLKPDREPAMVQRLVAVIADADAGDAEPV